jgi:hypothetical protein
VPGPRHGGAAPPAAPACRPQVAGPPGRYPPAIPPGQARRPGEWPGCSAGAGPANSSVNARRAKLTCWAVGRLRQLPYCLAAPHYPGRRATTRPGREPDAPPGPGPGRPAAPGLVYPLVRLVTCSGPVLARGGRNSTERSVVHAESRNNYFSCRPAALRHPARRGSSYHEAISIRAAGHHLRRNNLAMNCRGLGLIFGLETDKPQIFAIT